MNAIADLRGKGRLDHTVAVAVESAESPPELLRVADLLVAGPEGAHALVEYLARGDSA